MNAPLTTVDYLRFRDRSRSVSDLVEALRPMFGDLGDQLFAVSLEKGRDGWQSAVRLMIGKPGEAVEAGRTDFGGESQAGWQRTNISGFGCSLVQNWNAIERVASLPEAQIRRADLALTTWRGEVTHDVVVHAHEQGEFVRSRGGRPPNLRQIISSDPRAGRTCYIGERTSPLMDRCYEKGFEMAAPFRGTGQELHEVNGCPVEDIYRVELELKAVDLPVPWDAINDRDEYFAGAYPFHRRLLPDVDPEFVLRPTRSPVRDLAAALAHLRQQWGDTLFTALVCHHGDIGAVMERIIGTKHNERLVEAGVLTVEHV